MVRAARAMAKGCRHGIERFCIAYAKFSQEMCPNGTERAQLTSREPGHAMLRLRRAGLSY